MMTTYLSILIRQNTFNICILDGRGWVVGTLEGFLDNMSNIPAPPAFRSTYRDFFNHILLKFAEGLRESATGLILDEGWVKGNDDVISTR